MNLNRPSSGVVTLAVVSLVASLGLTSGRSSTGEVLASETAAAKAAASEVPATKQVTLAFTVNNFGYVNTCG